MSEMDLFFDNEVQKLIDSFAYCFRVRITLFSANMEVLFLGLHNEGCGYCQLIQQKLLYRYRCSRQDRMMCTRCENNSRPLVYRCYAGLEESVIPIKLKSQLVGYAMLGQFRTQKAVPDIIMQDWHDKKLEPGILQAAFLEQPFFEKTSVDNMLHLFSMLCTFIVSRDYIKFRRLDITEQVIHWVEEHISEPFLIDDAANHIGCSQSTISHTIKQHLHMNFKQFCIQKKIARFERIIVEDPTVSIAEAARKVGYDDPFYFSRLYKKIRLTTPSVFVTSIRKQ